MKLEILMFLLLININSIYVSVSIEQSVASKNFDLI